MVLVKDTPGVAKEKNILNLEKAVNEPCETGL